MFYSFYLFLACKTEFDMHSYDLKVGGSVCMNKCECAF